MNLTALELRKIIWIPPLILGVCLVLGLYLLGYQNNKGRGDNTISVTGSVKRHVTADLGKWNVTFSRRSSVLGIKDALNRVAADAVAVRKFVTTHGIEEASSTLLPVSTEAVYARDTNGYGTTDQIVGYTVRQEMRVENKEIAKVELLAKDLTSLVDQGIIADYQHTEYFYTGLDMLRPELFAEATKDAKTRAEAVAAGTGNRVGAIRSARTGVVQVLAPNSTDVSDYGSYDLSTKEKEISATVTVSFELGR